MAQEKLNEIFTDEPEAYDKKIIPQPVEDGQLNIDTNDEFFNTVIEAATSSVLDLSKIESFSMTAQTRDRIMTLIDTMCEDPIISAVVQTLTEDVTEANENGRIVWVESDDSTVLNYMNFLIDSMNIDKYIYKWANCVIKYGDVYVKLFRDSEIKKDGFFKYENKTLNESADLDESVKLIKFPDKDPLSGYVEMITNPAEVFELSKFGKTQGFIKANIPISQSNYLIGNKDLYGSSIQYQFNAQDNDVEVYEADSFVHGILSPNKSRVSETVELFKETASDDGKTDKISTSYNVNTGESILYNTYRIWRELSLLETSVILNRTTRSQLVRIIGVQVGDMPKEKVTQLLNRVKSLMEQKSALNTGESLNEYTNPGPVENNIYVPIHGEIGTISANSLGGDVDVKGLADLEYFRDKLFGSLGIPKQYFGSTGDSAGFDAGSSLAQLSARYAKKVKMVQNALINMITDMLNLIALSRGLETYVNKFTVKMLAPATQEEATRQENINKKLDTINTVIGMLSDVQDPLVKLKVITSFLSSAIPNDDVINILNDAIEQAELEQTEGIENEDIEIENSEEVVDNDNLGDLDKRPDVPDIGPDFDVNNTNNEKPQEQSDESSLPTPADLGIDMTDNNNVEV